MQHLRKICKKEKVLILSMKIFLSCACHIKKFCTNGCSSQFRSQFTFCSLCYSPAGIELAWDYGKVNCFRGSHDVIGSAVERKIYSDISTQKLKDAHHFAVYVKTVCNINVYYH